MPDRAGSRTPQAPRSGVRGCRFCLAKMDQRALRARLRQAKLGAPRLLEPVRSGMTDWDVFGEAVWRVFGVAPLSAPPGPGAWLTSAGACVTDPQPPGRDRLFAGLGALVCEHSPTP
jgi:hypothetical protein